MQTSISIQSKLANVGTSIFSVMTQKAVENDALNVSQGFPDFDVSSQLIDLVDHYMRTGKNQYAPMPGLPQLRLKISEKIAQIHGTVYSPESEITVTAGATQALNSAITAFVREGDEVILFEPAYDSYEPVVRLNGGQPVFVKLKFPDYRIDWEEVKKVITARTRMIIINTPHNPTGMVMSDDDMKNLERMIQGTRILVLSDEVYEHIVFDQKQHLSVSRYPKLAERSIIVSSFGKTYHTTGWKVGYAVAPEALMREFRKVHQFQVFTVNTPIQYALAEYINLREKYMLLGEFYQERRNYFLNLMKGSRFEIVPAQGTYFQLIGFKHISDDKDIDFVEKLVTTNKIATIPVSVFYHDKTDEKVLRICFAKTNNVLEKAAEILKSI